MGRSQGRVLKEKQETLGGGGFFHFSRVSDSLEIICIYMYVYINFILFKCHLLYVIYAFKFCKNLIKKTKKLGKIPLLCPIFKLFLTMLCLSST